MRQLRKLGIIGGNGWLGSALGNLMSAVATDYYSLMVARVGPR